MSLCFSYTSAFLFVFPLIYVYQVFSKALFEFGSPIIIYVLELFSVCHHWAVGLFYVGHCFFSAADRLKVFSQQHLRLLCSFLHGRVCCCVIQPIKWWQNWSKSSVTLLNMHTHVWCHWSACVWFHVERNLLPRVQPFLHSVFTLNVVVVAWNSGMKRSSEGGGLNQSAASKEDEAAGWFTCRAD